MMNFTYVKGVTIDQAVAELGVTAKAIAGGTDLLGTMKDEIHPTYPKTLVDIKTIPGLDYIKEEGGLLKIGALTRLADIAENTIVKSSYEALAGAVLKVATPQIREMGTIAGNLCQEVRCWYYRNPQNRFFCLRKGGKGCFAPTGDNRYHAIIGGAPCFAVCPSDTAIALTALDATIVTNRQSIPIEQFFTVLGNVLADNEIVTEIQVPMPVSRTRQTFSKFAIRKAIDFAMVSVATAIATSGGNVSSARIVLGAVAPVPYRAIDAENALKGNAIDAARAETAGAAAVRNAVPLSNNKHKVQIAQVLVRRAILEVSSEGVGKG